jgi:hypothetical protein
MFELSSIEKAGFHRRDWLSGQVEQHGILVRIFYFVFGLPVTVFVVHMLLTGAYHRSPSDLPMELPDYGIKALMVLVLFLLGPFPFFVGLQGILRRKISAKKRLKSF